MTPLTLVFSFQMLTNRTLRRKVIMSEAFYPLKAPCPNKVLRRQLDINPDTLRGRKHTEAALGSV